MAAIGAPCAPHANIRNHGVIENLRFDVSRKWVAKKVSECPLIILAITLVFVRWIGASRSSQLLGIGVLWGVLTLAFEILFGRFVVGASWERMRSEYSILEGGLMPFEMVVLVLSPWIAAKLQGVA